MKPAVEEYEQATFINYRTDLRRRPVQGKEALSAHVYMCGVCQCIHGASVRSCAVSRMKLGESEVAQGRGKEDSMQREEGAHVWARDG